MSHSHHRLFDLSEQHCRDLLSSHRPRLGRMAFAEGGDPNWPAVLPVNYVYHDGHIYVRTFEGSKLFAALRQQRVAFEIDVIDASWEEGWSVVVVGPLRLVDDVDERATIEPLLHSWVAGAAQHLVRLDIEHLSGREIVGAPPP